MGDKSQGEKQKIIRKRSKKENVEKSQKKLKKPIDKRESWCYNIKSCPFGRYHIKQPQKNIKKSEKTFKKGIDKRKRLWYNIKVAAEKQWQRSLKIEQQERSTKLKIVCVLDLEQFKENTTQNKSKNAKSKARLDKIESTKVVLIQ